MILFARIRSVLRGILASAAILGFVSAAASAPRAMSSVPFSSQRDCQVVRECNFTRSGVYRGCISAYSCRVCRFVTAPCPERWARSCRQLQCSWQ
jgi:hypothetical protein